MGTLACHRMEGPQTFDKLASLMSEVHSKFGLEGKILRTVTDNGANFCKSFREFGPRPGRAATAPLPPVEDMDEVEEVLPSQPQPQYRNEREDEAPGDHEYIDDEIHLPPGSYQHLHVEEMLEEGSEEGGLYNLPEHLRCAAHTLNLVACQDVKNVLENDHLHKSAIDQKANDLWKKSRASTNAMDIIRQKMKRRLVTPGQTRWNSKYDALVCLTKLMEGEDTRQVIKI